MGQEFGQLLAQLQQPWSNQACLGYAKICCRNLGYTQEETQTFLKQMSISFSNYTLADASKYGQLL